LTQIPTIGQIVRYTLSASDVVQIMRRRTTGEKISLRMQGNHPERWPAGAQAHIGNAVVEGDTFPMLIVKTWGNDETSAVNGQVFLDGCDVFWTQSVKVGDGSGTFSWPTRTQRPAQC
jgi:hypothetical protein